MTMIQPRKGFPRLRGRAADIASLDAAMLDLFTSQMDEANEQHCLIRLFLDLNHQLCELLEEF